MRYFVDQQGDLWRIGITGKCSFYSRRYGNWVESGWGEDFVFEQFSKLEPIEETLALMRVLAEGE